MKVKAIVVTYNGLKWIDRCLGSLRRSSVPIEVIVIDNGSTDGTVEKIRAEFVDVHLITNSENLGFGKANNIGIAIGLDDKADYFFLLNQDAWVNSDSIKKLIEIHKENSQYGILAPIRKFRNNQLELDVLKNIIDFGAADLISDLFFKIEVQNIYSIDFIAAAAWLISSDCIKKIGGFDPIFFHYGEDNDYCSRAKLSGFKIGICPNILVTHDTGDRIPDQKMIIRKKFASIIFHLRYTQMPIYRYIYYRFGYLYIAVIKKDIVSARRYFNFNYKLHDLRIDP